MDQIQVFPPCIYGWEPWVILQTLFFWFCCSLLRADCSLPCWGHKGHTKMEQIFLKSSLQFLPFPFIPLCFFFLIFFFSWCGQEFHLLMPRESIHNDEFSVAQQLIPNLLSELLHRSLGEKKNKNELQIKNMRQLNAGQLALSLKVKKKFKYKGESSVICFYSYFLEDINPDVREEKCSS